MDTVFGTCSKRGFAADCLYRILSRGFFKYPVSRRPHLRRSRHLRRQSSRYRASEGWSASRSGGSTPPLTDMRRVAASSAGLSPQAHYRICCRNRIVGQCCLLRVQRLTLHPKRAEPSRPGAIHPSWRHKLVTSLSQKPVSRIPAYPEIWDRLGEIRLCIILQQGRRWHTRRPPIC